MGKAPAVIIITRHGARLDAVDKEWHLKSSTPYDPPLSYGGWTQTRALGARIASLVHARDIALNSAGDNNDSGQRPRRDSDVYGLRESARQTVLKDGPGVVRRKHRVVIHSSPFLRCVQSSVAISAGIAQYMGNLTKFEAQRRKAASQRPPGPASRSKTIDAYDWLLRTPPTQGPTETKPPGAPASFLKPTLRIDASLGEWLCPDYFENIEAPPPSQKLVAGAKADLMHSGTPIQGAILADLPSPLALEGNELDLSPPTKQRKSTGYVPPTPNYAILPSSPIPRGYVAHARDACIKIDFTWDSARAPQAWGDGGVYGEEWSSMHNRFRKSLSGMIKWYQEHDGVYNPQDSNNEDHDDDDEEEEEEEEDVILVIVTHGAGCNALIGALTNQPVLMDVGMASLTMAVHNPNGEPASPASEKRRLSTSQRRRGSSVDCSQAAEYEMKLVASSEHLRAGTDPLKIPQLMSPRLMPSIPEGSSSGTSSGALTPVDERPKNSALGSMRRTRLSSISAPVSPFQDAQPSPTGSNGLWSSRQQSAVQVDEELDLAAQSASYDFAQTTRETPTERQRASTYGTLPPIDGQLRQAASPVGSKGLWGGGSINTQPKRRWTFTDQS